MLLQKLFIETITGTKKLMFCVTLQVSEAVFVLATEF